MGPEGMKEGGAWPSDGEEGDGASSVPHSTPQLHGLECVTLSRTDFCSVYPVPDKQVPAVLSPSGHQGQPRGQIREQDTVRATMAPFN